MLPLWKDMVGELMAAIYIVKMENNYWVRGKKCEGKVRLANGRYRRCGRGFRNGQRVVRLSRAYGLNVVYHIEHYLDARGEQIYE
jgi:hypothetical protein